MISSTFGAPLGGTTRGGHQVFEPGIASLITPPNFGGGGGNCLPWIVVVAFAAPSTPVTCCAAAGPPTSIAAAQHALSAVVNAERTSILRSLPVARVSAVG